MKKSEITWTYFIDFAQNDAFDHGMFDHLSQDTSVTAAYHKHLKTISETASEKNEPETGNTVNFRYDGYGYIGFRILQTLYDTDVQIFTYNRFRIYSEFYIEFAVWNFRTPAIRYIRRLLYYDEQEYYVDFWLSDRISRNLGTKLYISVSVISEF